LVVLILPQLLFSINYIEEEQSPPVEIESSSTLQTSLWLKMGCCNCRRQRIFHLLSDYGERPIAMKLLCLSVFMLLSRSDCGLCLGWKFLSMPTFELYVKDHDDEDFTSIFQVAWSRHCNIWCI
jgi:hypothetical protein